MASEQPRATADPGAGHGVGGDQRVRTTCCAAGKTVTLKTGELLDEKGRVSQQNTVAMCAAGTMPGALQILWQSAKGGYHMEYGFSCMGYEIAGAMGIKLAAPEREVICFVGDGSYMMANAELATAAARKANLISIALASGLSLRELLQQGRRFGESGI